MKRKILMILLSCMIAATLPVAIQATTVPAMAGEDYSDGDRQQVYVWIQEGDGRFCYINDGGWSEAQMLTGWHTIDGETYYFYLQEMEDARYGQMLGAHVISPGGPRDFPWGPT